MAAFSELSSFVGMFLWLTLTVVEKVADFAIMRIDLIPWGDVLHARVWLMVYLLLTWKGVLSVIGR